MESRILYEDLEQKFLTIVLTITKENLVINLKYLVL